MLNGQLNDFASASHLTQVASYFDIVDTAVRTGDTNKRYSITTITSTAPSPPIPEGAWTNIHIAPTADNMCDLYNSFIEFKMALKVKLVSSSSETVKEGAGHAPAVWIGFKDAMDAIESYQIVANGQVVYTQPHAIEESFITNLATTDMVKDRDVFSKTTAKNIMDRTDTVMVGGLYELPNGTALKSLPEKELVLNLKVDIRRFLPLSGVKYLPAFVGNLELRVKFSTAGLVCLPMPWYDCVSQEITKNALTANPAAITNCFLPITETFDMYYGYDSTNKKLLSFSPYVSPVSMTITECFSVLSCFGIDDAIYQQLTQRYTNQSLSFPTQTLTFQAMNGTISSKSVDLALTSTPRFVDTIFMLFPRKANYRTVYVNPLFDQCQLTMGGYGNMPDIPCSSYGVINYEMLTNALNLNNDLVGLSEDVMKSAILNPTLTATNQLKGLGPNDITNFALAYPVSVDNSFQQGQTSSAPITYQFKGHLNGNSQLLVDTKNNGTPLMGFLKDSVFAIQIRPGGPPIIALDEFDISSPAGA